MPRSRHIPSNACTSPGRAPADPDGDLVDLVRRGDLHAALHGLMRRHGDAVYRYCRMELRDPVLADDVHQQVFIEAFRDLRRFAGCSTLRVWLFAIARHRVVDAARKRRRGARCVDDALAGGLADPRPLPTESIDEARLREALTACLARTDDRTRTAILLHYQQGFSFEQIAAICGEKASTLNARVNRALPRLREAIERYVRGRGRSGLPRASSAARCYAGAVRRTTRMPMPMSLGGPRASVRAV